MPVTAYVFEGPKGYRMYTISHTTLSLWPLWAAVYCISHHETTNAMASSERYPSPSSTPPSAQPLG
jgi:hypothetical protein